MEWALPAGVHALCTTRTGGVSQPPFDSLNLGDHVQDDEGAVQANRARLQRHMAPAQPIFLKQVHGVEVVVLDAHTPQARVADACVTTQPHVACTIMVADCMPLLFTDIQGRVVGAAHAGWRGLAAGVIEQTVHTMQQQVATRAKEIQVWLGPCIGPSHFEVGDDVYVAFVSQDEQAQACFEAHPMHANKWLVDLPALARLRLRALGVESISGNDSSLAWCTVAQHSKLFSFRRDGITGRFAVCIWRDGV
jgi:YfiH family protein